MAQDPLLAGDEHHESFNDEEEAIHIPLWQRQNSTDESSSTSSASSIKSALLAEYSNDDAAEAPLPKLPLALLLSYAICGLTMSLPALPMMHILNTKVPLSLSVLPTYGALSFMPYSFKPFYAYMSSYFPRRVLLPIGWATCALTTLAWMWVPSVPWVFVVGIANSVAMSWSSFLLGLTLIDTARALSLSSTTTTINTAFEKVGSLFQSQAATARNVGSLTASVLTCIIFGMNHSDQNAFSTAVVNGIFWSTAGCHMISFLLVLWCQDSFAPTMQRPQMASCQVEDPSMPRRPSYAALEMYQTEDESSVSDEDDEEQSTFSCCNMNIIVIATLQVAILGLALKQQILSIVTQYPMVVSVLGAVSISVSALLLLRLYCSGTKIGARCIHKFRKSWGRSHVVGLVLILRHAVPSPSSVLYSFLYHCFQAQPIWLQVFSLVDSGIVTLASWSYQKLWAPRYSHGRKLITFMMITTVVAQSTGSLYSVVVNSYKEGTSLSAQSMFPWFVLAIKAISTFVSEWNFLPSVVLATVSVSEPTPNDEEDCIGCEEDNTQTSPIKVKPSLSTNVMYGSFISCIDFGDQIGAIMSVPLVTALGITRESNWHNLDTLLYICSGLGVLSVGFLFLLIWQLPERRPRGQSS